jgi:hypothetical protein
MRPGLEQVLDLVLKTDKGILYMLDPYARSHLPTAIKEVEADIGARPEHYLCMPDFDGFLGRPGNPDRYPIVKSNSLRATLDATARRSHYEHFDLVQRHLFPLHLCAVDGKFGVYEKPRGEVKPVRNTLRSAVESLRDAGMTVRWQQENTIHRYAHAYGRVGYEVYDRARRRGQHDAAEAREAWINSPG